MCVTCFQEVSGSGGPQRYKGLGYDMYKAIKVVDSSFGWDKGWDPFQVLKNVYIILFSNTHVWECDTKQLPYPYIISKEASQGKVWHCVLCMQIKGFLSQEGYLAMEFVSVTILVHAVY